MYTELITHNIWEIITNATIKANQKSYVAVAYLGQGGAKMLPLTKGSILVVDASEKSIKSGQTCPHDLLALYNKGVRVFSFANLHAKIYVIGHKIFIGSSNVSNNSAYNLQEAVIYSNDKSLREQAKLFIENLCKDTIELGPAKLKKLKEIYVPPKQPSGSKGNRKGSANRKLIPPLYLFSLSPQADTKEEQRLREVGRKEAIKKKKILPRHQIEQFEWDWTLDFKVGDLAVQFITEGKRDYLSPPGEIIHIKHGVDNLYRIVYIEIPKIRRKNFKTIKNKLNSEERKRFLTNGRKPRDFARRIKEIWKLGF